MTSLRRRTYDRLPGPMRKPVRIALERLRVVTAGVSRGTLRESLRGSPSDELTAAASRRASAAPARPTILVVDDRVPEHDVHAGALTTYHYLGILRRAGWRVIFRPDDGQDREPYAGNLRALGVELLLGELDVAAWLAQNGRDLDEVLLARPTVARRYLHHVRKRSDARVFYLDHDLHYLREQRRYEVTGDADALNESRRLLEVETDLFRAVDVVLTFSPDEVAQIQKLAPGSTVRVVTPAFYVEGTQAASTGRTPRPRPLPMAQRTSIVFVGAYDHRPNEDAAVVLVHDVMPAVWREFPGTVVTLIGGHVTPAVASLAGDRVVVAGHVQDIDSYWRHARMSVSALRFGSGVKGKIIASLEASIPVVTTPVGNEGIGLHDGVEALIGDDAEALARHATTLLRDPVLAEALAARGSQVLRSRFHEGTVRSDLLAALSIERE
jgi:glycosyltransferase involved in cell wall biosynthesis